MKNVIRTLAVVAAIATLVPAAQAGTATADVTVTVSLASKCRWQGGGATDPSVTVDFGSYVAFQSGDNSGTTPTVTLECTRGYGAGPTATWDTTNGDASGGGVVAGLAYTLTATPQPRQGGNTPSTTDPLGTPDTLAIKLGGTMPGGQAGAGTTATVSGSVGRVLTLTF
jgi:hypothetical protein